MINFKWIKKYYKLMILGSIVILLFQFIIVIGLQTIFNIWLGSESPIVSYPAAISFGIFGGIFAIQSTVSTFAMGFNKLKLQAILYSFAVAIKLILIYILTKKH